MDDAASGADVALEIAGQKVNFKNVKSLNTGATLFSCGLLILLCYAFWAHSEDTKTAQAAFIGAVKEQTSAIKEQTTAQREQNCLMRFDQKDRQANADFCKQVTR